MADDVVFQEAVEALRGGNKTRAREILTGLIKNDQSNVEYWIWLSAAMETTKERIYCLQTAFKLDPQNVTAKRGLILLGALPADETIQPFPMDRPRAWEEKLLLAHEKPKPKGWAAVKASPIFRLGVVILLVGLIGSAIGFGLILPAVERNAARPATVTQGPFQTFTPTPTALGGRPQAQVTGTPGGLAELFGVQYTATPLYVATERSPETSDFLLQFNLAYQQGDWDQAISALQEVIKLKPDAAFAYYYLGEAHRFKGDLGNAQQNYNEAITRQPEFGPAYVGLARVQLQGQPNANVLPLLDQAIQLDPNFGEAHLERARVKIRDNDPQGAIADLGKANGLLPNSPLVFYELARARLQQGELDLALNTAQQAEQLDPTYLPNYLLLGQVHAALGNYEEAVKTLDFYLEYAPDDLAARLELGKLEFGNGEYEAVIRAMDAIIERDSNRREPYLYRLLANVELGNADAADADIDRVESSYPELFEASLAIVRAELLNGRNGNALLGLDRTLDLAVTDEQKALAYYWAATVHEARNEQRDAADYWELLLTLPEDAMTGEMRQTAEERLLDIRPPAPAASPTRTPNVTPTRTPTPARTATPTATP